MKKKYPDVTAERLREVMTYDPETGIFRWRIRNSPRCPVGTTAGSLTREGYVKLKIDCLHISGARAAWLYTHGRLPEQQIDHIDGNRANNAISNLREASHVENSRNKIVKGYCINACSGTYRAYIHVNKKQINLGFYSNENDAKAAYTAASQTYFGQFSAANRPPNEPPSIPFNAIGRRI